jgi:hypothetical protein
MALKEENKVEIEEEEKETEDSPCRHSAKLLSVSCVDLN